MTLTRTYLALLGLILALFLPVAPAHAQATRTWVSGVGDDANPCSRTAPCKTFAGAISKTAVAGEINVLDPGGFGAVTITKSITIANDGVGTAGVLVSGTNGIVVSGAGVVVHLRGLDIEGLGTGLAGVSFLSGSALHVEKCTIHAFNAGTAAGINFAPSTAANLFVTDSTITENGNGSGGGGIVIAPGAGANSTATIVRTYIHDNSRAGISASAGTLAFIAVEESTISRNSTDGITAGTNATVTVDRSLVTYNNGSGINASAGLARVGSSTIVGNNVGVSGNVQSWTNNQLFGNTTDGTTSAIPGGLQ